MFAFGLSDLHLGFPKASVLEKHTIDFAGPEAFHLVVVTLPKPQSLHSVLAPDFLAFIVPQVYPPSIPHLNYLSVYQLSIPYYPVSCQALPSSLCLILSLYTAALLQMRSAEKMLLCLIHTLVDRQVSSSTFAWASVYVYGLP